MSESESSRASEERSADAGAVVGESVLESTATVRAGAGVGMDEWGLGSSKVTFLRAETKERETEVDFRVVVRISPSSRLSGSEMSSTSQVPASAAAAGRR